MKKFIAVIIFLCFILCGCGTKTFTENDNITFDYKKGSLIITEFKSEIMPGKAWLNKSPAGRLTIVFTVKNDSEKDIRIDKEDFRAYFEKEEEYYLGELQRLVDDFDDSKMDLYDAQKYIVFPDKEAHFNYIYWLPYSETKSYYKNILWGQYEKEKLLFKVKLSPNYVGD